MKRLIFIITLALSLALSPKLSADNNKTSTESRFTLSLMAGHSIGSEPTDFFIAGWVINPEEFSYWNISVDAGYKYYFYRHFFVEPQIGLFTTVFNNQTSTAYVGLDINGLLGYNIKHIDFFTGAVGNIGFNRHDATYRGVSWRFGISYNIKRVSLKAAFDLRLNDYIKNDVEKRSLKSAIGSPDCHPTVDIMNSIMIGLGYNF